jgi:hypothetical protein
MLAVQRRHVRALSAAVPAALVGGLVFVPAASAASAAPIAPLAFLGIELPSLHSIIEAIAKGFFGALAHALVPSWLTHGTVATIQALVAVPDPATWPHVGQLQGDMVWLAASLLPVTLGVGTVRYWLMGFTGAAHPATAVGRCMWVTFILVTYRWLVEQAVAMANTVTHAILGFPVVAAGLQRIITVLFGGALLSGAGGVFGAFLVLIGVVFAAALFACQVALTFVLAVLFVAGPFAIAWWPIPETSAAVRIWANVLMGVLLVPVGWTILFATAGALTLDATSASGGAGSLPGHIEAAFAALITFVLAVLWPLKVLTLRPLLGMSSGAGGGSASMGSTMPGTERVRAAHARLRSAALEGVPSLGRSAGRAAGALGAPAGGPLGAARRGLAGAARRTGILPGAAIGAAGGGLAAGAGRRAAGAGARRGVRERLRDAGAVIAGAPRDARAAMAASSRQRGRTAASGGPARAAARGSRGSSTGTGGRAARVSRAPSGSSQAASKGTQRPGRGPTARPQAPSASAASAGGRPSSSASRAAAGGASPTGSGNPGRRVTSNAQREATGRASQRPARAPAQPPPPTAPRPQRPQGRSPRRKPRPRSGS